MLDRETLGLQLADVRHWGGHCSPQEQAMTSPSPSSIRIPCCLSGKGFCFHLVSPCLGVSFSPDTVGFRTEGDTEKRAQYKSVKLARGRRQGDEYADHFQELGDKASVPRTLLTLLSAFSKDSLGEAGKAPLPPSRHS